MEGHRGHVGSGRDLLGKYSNSSAGLVAEKDIGACENAGLFQGLSRFTDMARLTLQRYQGGDVNHPWSQRHPNP